MSSEQDPTAGAQQQQEQDQEGLRGSDAAHAARSGLLQILAGISQSLTGVTQIVAARLFGPVAFGTYQTCLAIAEMLSRAGMGGADKGMLRYVAGFRARGEEHDIDRAIGTGLRLCWLLAGCLAIGAVAVTRLAGGTLVSPGVAAVMPFMAPIALLTGTTLILVQASLAVRVMRANLLVRGLAEPALLLAAMVTAWALGGGMRAMGAAHSAAAALTVAVAFLVVGRVFGYRRLRHAARAPALPGFASFALPIGVSELANAVLQRADILIVTSYLGVEAAAFYVAAEFLSRVVENVRYAFDSVTAGLLSEALHVGDRARLRHNLALMTRWTITATLPLSIVVVGLRHDLLALYGPRFVQASTAFLILACSHTLGGCLGLTGWTLMVAGRSRALMLLQICSALVNITLCLVLIPRFGLVGGALASLSAYTCLLGGLLVTAWVAESVHPFERAQLRPLVAAAAALLVQLRLPLPALAAARVAVVVLPALVVYGGVLLALGLPPEERRVLANLKARWRGRSVAGGGP